MSTIDISAVDQIIREVAVEQIMPRFQKLAEGDVQMKGVNDPVTIADQESERHLTMRFTDYLPGSVVVGEEGVSKDKSVMEHLGRDTPLWIIDPIDGTRNFVAGKPEFAVMVALVYAKKTVAAWIHDPNSRDTIMAEQGSGVWLRGKKLSLAAKNPRAGDLIGLVGARVKKLIGDASVMPQGLGLPKVEIGSCAGFDYPRLFTGEVTFANAQSSRAGFLFYRHTNAWDHAPGYFLHQEGGGYGANWAGKPYDPRDFFGGLLFAANQEEWMRLHKAFEPLMLHVLKNAVWDW
jgi:fructose-1,6-bisphosphatase/inositol monophosphatase family enzyme